MPVADEPELFGALGRGTEGFQDIYDTPESDWLDFKSRPYDLASEHGRFELAKDVSGLAEHRGGVVVIGVRTRQEAGQQEELADKLRAMSPSLTDVDQIRKTVAALVYPPLDPPLELNRFPMDDGKEVVTLRVERQDDAMKPFIVLGAVDETGRQQGNVFGYFKRQGDSTPPVPAQFIQSILRDGRRFQKFLENSDPRALLLGLPLIESVSQVPVDNSQAREEQLQSDIELMGIPHGPYLVVQGWPQTLGEVRGLLETGPQGLRSEFERGVTLRPSGFNLDFGGDIQVLRTGGLRKVRQEGLSMSLLRTGLLTVVVGPRYLGWASESIGRESINTWALVEFITETCRFACGPVKDRLAPPSPAMLFQASLRDLDKEGPRRLGRGLPSQWLSLETLPPAESADGVLTRQVTANSGERAAYELLSDIYSAFGIAESNVPFADTESRTIDIAALVEQGRR